MERDSSQSERISWRHCLNYMLIVWRGLVSGVTQQTKKFYSRHLSFCFDPGCKLEVTKGQGGEQ